jgi:hypothetical protein
MSRRAPSVRARTGPSFEVDKPPVKLQSKRMTPVDPDGSAELDASHARAASVSVPLPTPVRITIADIVPAVPDLVLAGSFLAAWVDPSTRGVPTVRCLVMIVLLEFFIVHSSGFMGAIAFGDRDRRTTIAMTLGLAAYLFAVGIGAASEPPPLGITAGVIQAQGFTIGGLWTEHPQTALAAGAIYFAIMGTWELLIPPVVFRRDRARAALDRAMVITA